MPESTTELVATETVSELPAAPTLLFHETQEDLHRDYKVENTMRDIGSARRATRERKNEGWLYTTDVDGGEDGVRLLFGLPSTAPVRIGVAPTGTRLAAAWRMTGEPTYEPEF